MVETCKSKNDFAAKSDDGNKLEIFFIIRTFANLFSITNFPKVKVRNYVEQKM